MDRIQRVALFAVCVWMSACGGSSGSEQQQQQQGQSAGGEDECEGFDPPCFASDEPPAVDHGDQNPRELIGVHGPPQDWDSMNHEAQEWFMIEQVLPIAAWDFRQYDANRYATFDCTNCHGLDADERHYEMPSRYLPALPEPNSAAWSSMRERNPRGFAFMMDVVTPTIRTQIGEPELGCFGCHPHAQ